KKPRRIDPQGSDTLAEPLRGSQRRLREKANVESFLGVYSASLVPSVLLVEVMHPNTRLEPPSPLPQVPSVSAVEPMWSNSLPETWSVRMRCQPAQRSDLNRLVSWPL